MVLLVAWGCVVIAAVELVRPTATPPDAPSAVNLTLALKKMP
jgi:hypothetical protein